MLSWTGKSYAEMLYECDLREEIKSKIPWNNVAKYVLVRIGPVSPNRKLLDVQKLHIAKITPPNSG